MKGRQERGTFHIDLGLSPSVAKRKHLVSIAIPDATWNDPTLIALQMTNKLFASKSVQSFG